MQDVQGQVCVFVCVSLCVCLCRACRTYRARCVFGYGCEGVCVYVGRAGRTGLGVCLCV